MRQSLGGFFFLQSELYGLVLVWDLRQQPAGEELAGGCSILAPDVGKCRASERKDTKSTCFTCYEEGTNIRDWPGSYLFTEAAVWTFWVFCFFFPWDRSWHHFFSPHQVPSHCVLFSFFLSLEFCGFCSSGEGDLPFARCMYFSCEQCLLSGLWLVLAVN